MAEKKPFSEVRVMEEFDLQGSRHLKLPADILLSGKDFNCINWHTGQYEHVDDDETVEVFDDDY